MEYSKTAKHTKTPFSLYIFLKKSKKIFFHQKSQKMLFCCIVLCNLLIIKYLNYTAFF